MRQHLTKQGYAKIEYTDEIRNSFDSVSFIANYGNRFASQEWHTRFYVDGWYECVLAQEVDIVSGDLVPKGTLKLHINEISMVEGRSIRYSEERILRGDELKRFVESGFDLKVAGFKSVPDRPDPPRDFMAYWHRLYPEQEK